jgi:hypothetical protein
MLADVQQKTIGPLIKATIAPGSVIYTDEYDIYHRLTGNRSRVGRDKRTARGGAPGV